MSQRGGVLSRSVSLFLVSAKAFMAMLKARPIALLLKHFRFPSSPLDGYLQECLGVNALAYRWCPRILYCAQGLLVCLTLYLKRSRLAQQTIRTFHAETSVSPRSMEPSEINLPTTLGPLLQVLPRSALAEGFGRMASDVVCRQFSFESNYLAPETRYDVVRIRSHRGRQGRQAADVSWNDESLSSHTDNLQLRAMRPALCTYSL